MRNKKVALFMIGCFVAGLYIIGDPHSAASKRKSESDAKRKVTLSEREKTVAGDVQKAFPSPDSGAKDLADKVLNIIREMNYSAHRFVLVGFRAGRDKKPNRFGEVLIESLTHALQRSSDIQLTADRTMIADVLNQLSLELSDIYDDKTVARVGKAVGATAILRVRMELMPSDRNINVYLSGIHVESGLPLPGFSAQTLFDYSGDNKYLWDEDYSQNKDMDFQIQLVGKKQGINKHFPVTPNTILSEGDGIKLWIRANNDVWFYAINLDSAGNLNVLFPSKHIKQLHNPVVAGTEVYLPPDERAFYILDGEGTGGNEEIRWAVSREPRKDIEALIKQIESGRHEQITPDEWNRKTRGLKYGEIDDSPGVKKTSFNLHSNPESLISYHFHTTDIVQGGIFSFIHL
jgi:hypothetical protein